MVTDRIEILDGLLSRLLGPLGSNHKVIRLTQSDLLMYEIDFKDL